MFPLATCGHRHHVRRSGGMAFRRRLARSLLSRCVALNQITMKIYKNQAEIQADIKDGVLAIKGNVLFECSFRIEARIEVKAGNIKAWDIEAGNIEAWNIEAGDISFYAVAFAYLSFKCKSIVGRRNNSKYFCLDKEVEITK